MTSVMDDSSRDSILGDSQAIARVLAEATAKAEAQGDDSGSSMSFGEKKLLLRHRDSFIMNKNHLAEGHEGSSASRGLLPEESMRDSEAPHTEAGYTEDLHALDALDSEQNEARSALSLYSSPRPSLATGPSQPSDFSLDEGMAETSPRRKSRVFSFIKGVATVLGLRVSKKNRTSGGDGSGSPGTPTRGSSFSSPGGGFSPYAGAGGQVDAESFYKGEYDPPRDETGNFVPTHRLHPGPRSILKATPSNANALSDSARSQGDYSSDTSDYLRVKARAANATPRRGLTFADQHGHELQEVRFSERLHYSGGSEAVNWGEENGRRCSIM